jgi:general nucleoside transport system permease protein
VPLVVIAVSVVMGQTTLGISIQASGEDPRVLDKAGLSALRLRYGVILFTGVLAALGGAFLSIGDIHTFTEGMTNGAGYLAIAAVIFGKWKVGRTALACLLFGAATALQFQLPAMGIQVPNALLIMTPYLLAFLSVAGLVGRQTAPRALATPYWR